MDNQTLKSRRRLFRKSLAVMVFLSTSLISMLVCSDNACAQLPRDIRDQFEGLLEDLDPAVAKRFQDAIDNDRAAVTFTPQEFRKFRDNPINPYEETYKIEPDDSIGELTINFEIPSLRNRRSGSSERQSPQILQSLEPLATSVADSMVGVWKGDRMVALGTIVGKDGYFVTKASEVQKRAPVKCLVNGQYLSARIHRIDEENDVALLKVAAEGWTPIKWDTSEIPTGSFVVIPSVENKVVALGTYSAKPRSTVSGEQAFLGVNPDDHPRGVSIADVQAGDASHDAGLRDGDIIFEMAGKPIVEVGDLVNAVRRQRPGDVVEIKYYRSNQTLITRATLAGRNLSAQQAARFKMMNRMGTIVSRRNSNFPVVFQHDAPLFPENCGGPVLDLNGNVIGVNIARQGRASSLAIPAGEMQEIIKALMRSTVASSQ